MSYESDNEYEPGCEEEEILPVFIPKTKFTPLPHQEETLKFMKRRELDDDINGGILALSPGLGKTFTALYHSFINNKNDNFPTLIVCPKTTVYTWTSEIKKFFGNTLSFLVFRKDNPKVKEINIEKIKMYNVVITNYEYLRGISSKLNIYDRVAMVDINGNKFGCNIPHRPVLRATKGEELLYSIHWSRIICDESHNFSNYKTALWQSIMGLCGTYRWCLSGTCIRNYATDLYSQMKFLGYYEPEFDVKNFHNKNIGEYIMHFDYKKANIVLPEYTHKRIPCKIEDEQADVYNMFLTQTKKEFQNFTIGTTSFADIFVLFLRLRQVSIAPFTVCPESSNDFKKGKIKFDMKEYERSQKEIDKMTGGLSSWIRDKSGTSGLKSSKISKATQIIKGIKKGEKVIVFSMFKRVLDLMVESMELLEGTKKSYILIDGTVTGENRDRAINSFKNDNVDVLFISYKVGSESLNLTECSHIILMEGWFTHTTAEQAIARAVRMGQDKNVTVHELYTPTTENVASIEEAIYEICQNKKQIATDYFTKGKSEKGSKLDAKTLGQILSVRHAALNGEKSKKGMHCK